MKPKISPSTVDTKMKARAELSEYMDSCSDVVAALICEMSDILDISGVSIFSMVWI